MRASRINPDFSAYKALNGPYDWNQYPLALLGCKVVIYKDGNTRGLWASWGVDDGTWAHQWITTDVTFTTFLRLEHIKSWVPQNFSPNTAKCQIWPWTNTFAHSPTSWPNQQQLQVQTIKEDGSLSSSNQRLRISFIPLLWQCTTGGTKGERGRTKGNWWNIHPHYSKDYSWPSDNASMESNSKKSPEKYTAASLEIHSKQYLQGHTFDQKSPSYPRQWHPRATAHDNNHTSKPLDLATDSTKGNDSTYHKTGLAFRSNSAHHYTTGNKCTNHQGESDIQCYVHTLQSHATCSVTICSLLGTLHKSHGTSRDWGNYIQL